MDVSNGQATLADDHDHPAPAPPSTTMTTVSPFARASVFDEPRLGGREQSVSNPPGCAWGVAHILATDCLMFPMQIEEMYSVPESFLEIEVRNPQTHGECRIPARAVPHFDLCGTGALASSSRLLTGALQLQQASGGRCTPTTRSCARCVQS